MKQVPYLNFHTTGWTIRFDDEFGPEFGDKSNGIDCVTLDQAWMGEKGAGVVVY